MPVGALAWCHDRECFALFAFSVTGPLLRHRRSSLLCCDAECVVEAELVVPVHTPSDRRSSTISGEPTSMQSVFTRCTCSYVLSTWSLLLKHPNSTMHANCTSSIAFSSVPPVSGPQHFLSHSLRRCSLSSCLSVCVEVFQFLKRVHTYYYIAYWVQ